MDLHQLVFDGRVSSTQGLVDMFNPLCISLVQATAVQKNVGVTVYVLQLRFTALTFLYLILS